MTKFITVDINGWFDSVVDIDGNVKSLGFRSCLFKHKDGNHSKWLFGAQALASARYYRKDCSLIDACDALNATSGQLRNSDIEFSLPRALWQLVEDATRRTRTTVNLGLIIPDSKFLGTPEVKEATGKTPLEQLYEAFEHARPPNLASSRIEFIWRSVAALQAVIDQGNLHDFPDRVLVISVIRNTYWTMLEFRPWRGKKLIDRKPVMDNSSKEEALTHLRTETVKGALNQTEEHDIQNLSQWTRLLEILASGLSQKSLAKLGIDSNVLEHRCWPTFDSNWARTNSIPSLVWPEFPLPDSLRDEILRIKNESVNGKIPIVIESPTGFQMTHELEKSIKCISGKTNFNYVPNSGVLLAADHLVKILGKDSSQPAWLDHVPSVEIEIRGRENNKSNDTEWKTIVSEDTVIPAGEMYHSMQNRERRITLAPGTEFIHLHLRRGFEGKWDDRYTAHPIQPSDHNRVVEPLVRVRPLSGEARIEIVEHRLDETLAAVAAERPSIKWSDMTTNRPPALKSIPELYIFKASEEGWKNLKELLKKVVESTEFKERNSLRYKLDKSLKMQWKEKVFPLGSDGQPPRPLNAKGFQEEQELLARASNILLADLQDFINSKTTLKSGRNRLHMALTWLFTGCPCQTVNYLLDAVVNPNGNAGTRLQIGEKFSAWAIYSGIGRAAQNEDTFRTIYDTLIMRWEDNGGESQDKYLLAAVTHPMARRVGVRTVLNESKERFDRVKGFLSKQLVNILEGTSDRRPKVRQPSLELRYVTMGFRGLCQIRYENPNWFAEDDEETRRIYETLMIAKKFGTNFEKDLVEKTAPYLIGKGEDPTMPEGY